MASMLNIQKKTEDELLKPLKAYIFELLLCVK